MRDYGTTDYGLRNHRTTGLWTTGLWDYETTDKPVSMLYLRSTNWTQNTVTILVNISSPMLCCSMLVGFTNESVTQPLIEIYTVDIFNWPIAIVWLFSSEPYIESIIRKKWRALRNTSGTQRSHPHVFYVLTERVLLLSFHVTKYNIYTTICYW